MSLAWWPHSLLTATCEIGAGGAEEGAGSCSRGAQALLPACQAPSSCSQPDPEYLWRVTPAGRTRAFWGLGKKHFSSKLGRNESWTWGGEGEPPAGSFLLGPFCCWDWALPSLGIEEPEVEGRRAEGGGSPVS